MVEFGDYRLISLIGSIYKIMTKLFANQLRQVIREVICTNQFTFKRLMDSILIIANKIIDLKKERKGKLIFEVDFEKAYSNVSWKVGTSWTL